MQCLVCGGLAGRVDSNHGLRPKGPALHACPEGIRIDLMDNADFSMFELGTTILTKEARTLLGIMAETLKDERAPLILRGHTETIGARLTRDLEAMADLPAAPFDACDQASGKVSSQALVRYDTNDYSVPVAHGHQDVWIRGYVEEVVVGCRGEVIARHPRCYGREDVIYNPIHYLPLIEQKINSLDQAAPLAEWHLPEEFDSLRRLMEVRMLKMGRREYVQVLRLLETFGFEDLHAAVKHALRLGAVSFDAVKHLLLCRIEQRPPKLDLDIYPYLPRANVATTSPASYMSLMTEGQS